MFCFNGSVKTVTQKAKLLNTDRISTIYRWVAAAICLFFVSGASSASPQLSRQIQSHDDIRLAVHNYIQQETKQLPIRPKINVGHLDSRLRLAACDKPLEAFTTDGSKIKGRTTIGVRCRGSQPWSIHVPATIAIFENVAVTTTALMRGHLMTAADIRLEQRNMKQISGRHFIRDLDQIIGKVLKRPISEDKVIQVSYLEMPTLVRRGQIVTILAITNGLVVRMNGKSMMDGAMGDLIQVRNPKSKKIINGTVTAVGEVRVNL